MNTNYDITILYIISVDIDSYYYIPITNYYIPISEGKPPFSYGFPMVFLWLTNYFANSMAHFFGDFPRLEAMSHRSEVRIRPLLFHGFHGTPIAGFCSWGYHKNGFFMVSIVFFQIIWKKTMDDFVDGTSGKSLLAK